MLIRQLDESTEDITSIFAYPDKILEVERCKIILKELKKFDMVAYLTYYHKELTEEEKTSKIFEETLHNRYKGKVSAKFQYSGIKKIGVKVSEDTKLEGTSCIGFSTDPEGHNIVKSISQIEIDEKKLDVAINSTMFYVHYPYNSHKVICWGYGSDYKFGNNNTNTTTNPIQLQDFTKPIKQIHSQYNRTVILGEDGCIYYSGYVSEWGGYKYYMGKYDSGMPESPIVDLKVGNYNIAVMTEDHKIYIQGTDSGYHIDNCNSKYTLYHKERPNEEDEKIIAWDLGYYHHIYVTDNGKCYGAGNDFMRGIDLECNSKSYVEIKFDEGVVPKRPVCNHLSDTYKPCLMFVENNGKSELWSAGYTNYGLLGQGEGKNESKKWAPLNYDKDTIHFVDASIRYYAGMARTDDGRLFAWGSNNSGQIGLPERKYYYSPVEIPFFKDYYTHEFSCGDYHAMICASPLNHMEKKQIFLMGDIKGLNDTSGKNADGIYHFKKFDD